jgi:hypothetical protein
MRGPCYVSQREKHDKFGTTRQEVSRAQLAAEGTRDMVRQHKAKTEPFAWRLGRHKRLEHALDNVGRDCRAAIADGDAAADGLHLFSGRAEQDRLLLDTLHGIQRIAQDVAQHLLESRLIGNDAKIRVNVRHDINPALFDTRGDYLERFSHGMFNGDRVKRAV